MSLFPKVFYTQIQVQIMSTQKIKNMQCKKNQLKAIFVSEKPLCKVSNATLQIRKHKLAEDLFSKRLLIKAYWPIEKENMVNNSDTLKNPNRMLRFRQNTEMGRNYQQNQVTYILKHIYSQQLSYLLVKSKAKKLVITQPT